MSFAGGGGGAVSMVYSTAYPVNAPMSDQTCFRCSAVITVDAYGSWIDSTGGDACDDSAHAPIVCAPVSYQGGKQRLAAQILDVMGLNEARDGTIFYDLCCGSGAVTVELLNRGWDPAMIVMVDAGPWGRIWQALGEGSFDLHRFRAEIDAVPAAPRDVQLYLQQLADRPAYDDTVLYHYLILQAGAFGGKAVWVTGHRWKTPGFRSYWLPTATSSRRSPVNPMMPMAETLYERVALIASRARGIRAFCAPVAATPWDMSRDGIVYLDPPYAGTTTYWDTFDAEAFARSIPFAAWISEGRALAGDATQLSGTRAKGGISGNRVGGNEEWLTRVGRQPDKHCL